MPDRDVQSLSSEYILNNVKLAYEARAATPWGKDVPDDVFFNDVLPYASVNERRDAWRADFYQRFLPLVKNCQTPGEAAQLLNRDMFPMLGVKYHASMRPKPDQSPLESIDAKFASCSGLSILLIDACRAVAVPARFAGTPRWKTKRGNHSWVEIWSEGRWHFTGACEYSAEGLDNVWFLSDAAQAQRDDPRHAIYASSWKTTGVSFPLVWDRRALYVPALNVTDRYTQDRQQAIPEGKILLGIEVWSHVGGERVVSDLLIHAGSQVRAQGATTGTGNDTNHRLEVILDADTDHVIEFIPAGGLSQRRSYRSTREQRQRLDLYIDASDSVEGAARASTHALDALQLFVAQPRESRPPMEEQSFFDTPLTQQDALQAARLLWRDHAALIRHSRAAEMDAKQLTLADKTMKFHYHVYGEKPAGGRSLYLSLHGGGNASPRVNDRQWENQKTLYQPSEGVYLVPRAPTNTWNLWHEGHIDPLFDRLIESLVVFEDVNPNRVYLLGYSAGGDGVYQLAPRLADRLAAAAMMAGHPNEASPLGLRNIGFALHVGALDSAYKRNEVAAQWKTKLAELQQQDPEGYRHEVAIHEGKGHWMDREDAVALDWMAEFDRDPRPTRIVWYQDDVNHSRFYWLAVDAKHQRTGSLVRAEIHEQTADIQSDDVAELTVLLDDALLNLDQPITITLNGQERFAGTVKRTIGSLVQSLAERADPQSLYPARVRVRQ